MAFNAWAFVTSRLGTSTPTSSRIATIPTDKPASYPKALWRLKRDGYLAHHVEHRTSKYLNNVIEADYGAIGRVIRPTRGFQNMNMAGTTSKGFEMMRMIRRGHCILTQPGAAGEVRLADKLFGLAA
nr:DDE-type integrase/transposase/recombinase [Microvirga vignae]